MPGSQFAVGYLPLPPAVAGVAVGALVAGAVSVLVMLFASALGLAGAEQGWGGWVAGAFGVLAFLLGAAAVSLGSLGLRQLRQAAAVGEASGPLKGRGMAISGLVCGAVGALGAVAAVVLTLTLQLG
ncbi:hypothetical protein [Pilimelia columellifera]|uniref:hypothetical protein n=1 Tax=Pilimelia columellifera TaxID=706574 RepID=UPI0031D1EDC7